VASIQKLVSNLTGEVSYRAQVRVKGHATQGMTFPNEKEAKRWSTSVEAAIRENRHFPHMKASRTSFVEVAARYRKTGMGELKASGIATREQHLDWWVERFAGKTLAEITPDLVAAARDELAAGKYVRGKVHTDKEGVETRPTAYKRSGATVNRYLATLSSLFTTATKEWRLVDKNPVREISKKRETRGRVRFLSDDERGALLEACAASPWKPLQTLVTLAISTGARRGELINLKWTDVDLKGARATLHDTKNGDIRVLPLVGKALESLREMKLHGSARSEFVFTHPNGLPEAYEHFDDHWYNALTAAGIDNLKFHDLRHTTASYLAAQGASLLEIADVLGHKTMAMVKRYSHLAQSHKVSAIEKMAKERGL
jgi:integrase